MDSRRKAVLEFRVEELDRELVARNAKTGGKKQFKFKNSEGTPARDAMIAGAKELYKTAPPPNNALTDLSDPDLTKTLIFKTRSPLDITRGPGFDDLMDCYQIIDVQHSKNVKCVASVMLKDNLIDEKTGFSKLKFKNYGKTFNLCDIEPFCDQPVSAGLMFTGFLVKDDVIATAGHHVTENSVTDLRIVFGYKMLDTSTPVIRFSNEDIYQGVKMIKKAYEGKEDNWALVKLDRKVVGQTAAALSTNEISIDQPFYVIGYPLGLPLKFSAEAFVHDTHETYFTANLNVYSSSSGSPVFDFYTHEVIGMVVKNENCDFRWTGNCWFSVNYPDGKKANCTRVSEFIAAVQDL